ncbi:MAG: hypothetical protein ACT6SC_20215, partial [Blastomonas fulva]
MRLLSNVGTERVVDHLRPGTRLSVATGSASIFGLAQLQSPYTLERILLSPETDLQTDVGDRHRRNALTLRGEGNSLLQAISGAETRVTELPLRQSLLLCGAPTAIAAIVGDCDLTTAGLGVAPTRAAAMIQLLEDPAEIDGVARWFDELWRRSKPDGPNPLMAPLQAVTAPVGAAHVYQRALASLFTDMMAQEDILPDRGLGLEDSRIWQMLYRFQRDGVLGAIGKLRQWGGCIIADSVGLGKTFEALAVIKYHELRNERVLVLAPK